MHKVYIKFILITLCIIFSGCSQRSVPAPVTSLSSHPTKSSQKVHIKKDSYKVKAGETLYSIAFRANKDFREIAKINGIAKPYRIFPGQILKLKSPKIKTKKAKNYSNVTPVSTKNKQKSYKVVKKELDPAKKREYVEKQASSKMKQKKVDYSNKLVWKWPASGKVNKRFSNTEHGYKGIQIKNKQGTPIRAAADGIVVYSGSALRGYGSLVIVKHNDDYLSAYAHNKRILVREKQVVKSGQKIAEMGSSDAKITALRFEIRYRGTSVNPANYLPKH